MSTEIPISRSIISWELARDLDGAGKGQRVFNWEGTSLVCFVIKFAEGCTAVQIIHALLCPPELAGQAAILLEENGELTLRAGERRFNLGNPVLGGTKGYLEARGYHKVADITGVENTHARSANAYFKYPRRRRIPYTGLFADPIAEKLGFGRNVSIVLSHAELLAQDWQITKVVDYGEMDASRFNRLTGYILNLAFPIEI